MLREWSQAALEPEHQNAWEIRMTGRALLGKPFDKSGDDSDQKLIEARPSWQPKNSNYRASIGNAQRAGFSIYASIGDIYERAKSMINNHAGSLSNQVNMGIRPYLENLADPSEKSKRQKDFEAKFSSALKYSKPMVEENIKVLNAVHPGAAGGTYTSFSTIPLENLPLQEKIGGLVIQFDPENSAIQDKETFSSSESIREITIFSTTKGARNPVVFNTLIEPIYRDWISRANSSQTRQQFWTLRRTKPAPESIPVAQEVLDQMFIGWLALTFADLRKVEDTDLNKGRKVSVYSYREKKWVDFPHPLLGLGDAPRSFDTFPAVLNSLSIALLEVNITASITPLLAHHSLMDAGTDIEDDQEYGVNRVLRDYVQGTGPVAGDSGLTPEQRQANLIEDIQLEIKSLRDRFADADKMPNPFEMTAQYEWRELWLASLEKLLGHAQSVGSGGTRRKTRD